ncbi:hypothetical protein OG874_40585 [Nocardia sp. NBC_00565]|uniref:DUF7373 family lipoprotein n=1 Tax=Nocardia sp. NBC_00565 TaxID=2975993 RepID=UPI002E81B92B|nr:hypothetical protein [Nocardia sp. NBC_00565]WUC02924.1 hypothetical protein OG874_40585 [Nocardia sp. NBC_00565]
MKRQLSAAAALAVALLIGTSCASSIDGQPLPGLAPVDLSTLKTGAAATDPSPFKLRTSSDTAQSVRFIEARRMLNYVVQPFDVDSDLTSVGFVKLIADSTSMTADGALPEIYKQVGDNNNLVAGAYVSRSNGNLRSQKRLIISVLRFASDADSKNAADDFARITAEQRERHPIPIDSYPDARATSADNLSANAFQPHGPYVIAISAGMPEANQDKLAGTIKKTIDLQIPQIDRQQPVPVDDLLDLPLDPDGIMRRAAPKAKDYSDPGFSLYDEDFGPFEPAGILHFERNPIDVRKAFEEGGVDLIGRRAGTVYRARDLAAAIRLQTALTKPGKNDTVLDPPPGLGDAQCLRLDLKDLNRQYSSFCAIVYDRYVAVVISSFPELARVDRRLEERTAGQYSILVKSG